MEGRFANVVKDILNSPKSQLNQPINDDVLSIVLGYVYEPISAHQAKHDLKIKTRDARRQNEQSEYYKYRY